MIKPISQHKDFWFAQEWDRVNPALIRTLPTPKWREMDFTSDPEVLPEWEFNTTSLPPCPATLEANKIAEYIAAKPIYRATTTLFDHCTGTGIHAKPEAIIRYWRDKLGWKHMGYHVLILYSGEMILLQDFNIPSNGVRGHNLSSINVCYVGGVENGKATDTRSPEQKNSQLSLYKILKPYFRIHEGHNQKLNKACPSYNVPTWLASNPYT